MKALDRRLQRLETSQTNRVIPAIIDENGMVAHGGRKMDMATFNRDVRPDLTKQAEAVYSRTHNENDLIIAIDFRVHESN